MARTKFGSIITDIRGSVGGHTFTNGSSGTFMRTKVSPVSRVSDAVMRQRSCMLKLAGAWHTLSKEELDSWKLTAPLYTFTNSLGKVYSVSPYALFQALNTPIVLAGLPPVTVLNNPVSKNLNAFTFILYENEMSIFNSTQVQQEDDLFLIYASQPFSLGSRVANEKWKLLDILPAPIEGQNELPLLSTYMQTNKGRFGAQFRVRMQHSYTDEISKQAVKDILFTMH